MKTPQSFYDKYVGASIDYDKSFGVQCVDSFKIGCQYLGIPVKATPNNWADGYWYYKDQLGYSQWFDYIYDVKDLQQGDWCIWAKGSSCVNSHIAMYWKGVNGTHAQFFGENQDGKKYFCLANVKLDILGALRPKAWSGEPWINQGKMRGCDVSQWNSLTTDISQFDYVIIRATWGTNLDERANDWRLKCEREGKPYGVYCYSYALDNTGAKEEADYIMNAVKGWNIQLGIWYDMEPDTYKQKNHFMSAEQWTQACDTFCQAIQDGGYYTGIYASESYFSTHILTTRWDRWVASWGDNSGTIQRDTSNLGTMLQYTSNGGLDKDISYCELEHYRSYPVSTTEPVLEPIPEPVEPEPIQTQEPSGNASNEVVGNDYLFKMTNKFYDFLNWLVHIIPLFITLYIALSNTWHWTYTEPIIATISAVMVFLNSILKQSTIGYKEKGGD